MPSAPTSDQRFTSTLADFSSLTFDPLLDEPGLFLWCWSSSGRVWTFCCRWLCLLSAVEKALLASGLCRLPAGCQPPGAGSSWR